MAYILKNPILSAQKPISDKHTRYGHKPFPHEMVHGTPAKALHGRLSIFNNHVAVHHWQQGRYLNEQAYSTFYYRMLSSKPNFNFGIITGEKGEVFSIWNGYAETVSLNDIVYDNVDGVTITPIDGKLPISITPYRSKLLQLALSSQGSATINGSVTLVFSNGDRVVLNISGSRMVLMNVWPNWKHKYRETFEYKTNVLTSYNKKEQRRALLAQPRQSISYTGTVHNELLLQLRNKAYGWQNRAFMMPLWYQMGRLAADANIGDNFIEIKENPYDFFVGVSICLWDNFNRNEIFEIVKIENGIIYLNVPISNFYKKDTRVYPAQTMRVREDFKIKQVTDAVAEFNIDMIAESANMKRKMPVLPADVVYRNVEVLERKPNWKHGLVDETESYSDKVDYGYGIQRWFERKNAALTTRKLEYVIRNYEELIWWKAFIHRQLGSLKSFLVPSWTKDCIVVADYVAGTKFLDVRDDDLTTMLNLLQERQYLRIETFSKVYYATIIAVHAVNGIARFELADPMPDSINQDGFKKISFMQRCRFASDIISIEYITDSVAVLNLNFKQVREVS